MIKEVDIFFMSTKFYNKLLYPSFIYFVLVCLLFSVKVKASEYIPSVLEMVPSKSITIEREDILIRLDSITTSYLIKNTSPLDLIQTMIIRLPKIKNEQDNEIHRDAARVKVDVNGQLVRFQILERAMDHLGYDVTLYLKNMGLPLNPVDAAEIIQDRDDIIEKLQADERGRKLYYPPTNETTWTLETTYYWHQKFQGAESVHMKHIVHPNLKHEKAYIIPKNLDTVDAYFEYTINRSPIISRGNTELNETVSTRLTLSDYCQNTETLLKEYEFLKKAPHQFETFNLIDLRFSMLNQEHWATTIQKLSLRVEVPKNMQALFCWPDDKLTNREGTLMSQIENYKPNDALKVLYFEVNKAMLRESEQEEFQ